MMTLGVRNQIKRVGAMALDFLLPPRCAGCGVKLLDHGHLCGKCWSTLAPIAPPQCVQCGLPFSATLSADAKCGACLKNNPDFDWARAPVSYEGFGKDLVMKLKHGGDTAVVSVMANFMAMTPLPLDQAPQAESPLVVPVPLHPKRLRERRFNQSLLLARAVAQHLRLPVDPFVLERARSTPSQGTLKKEARLKNVKGAFVVTERGRGLLEGRSVLLIDDVLTTGATVSACATALKSSGVKNVGVLAFARVGNPSA